VNRDELSSGSTAGILAAASTGGALIALGKRTGTAVRPFNVIASHLLGARAADSFGFVPRITLTGVALHVFVTTLLGVLILGIVKRRLAPAWLASAGTALLCCLVSIGLARRGDPSLAQLFSVGDLAVYFLVLAVSLVLGVRFAVPLPRHD
jgi:hypothetical protein